MVIPRICSVSIFLFPFILFSIVVLHQLGIRANFDPHAFTQRMLGLSKSVRIENNQAET